ncbi:NADP-dependent oxidoreductase [Dyadobacter psychrotolerans]|uniref:NADP-dependent oxidoreductase n=1 Tax=Dyadobacter psychrotolerans TaxID=2541721 RepID=A0A4V2Z3Y9_9BACT|nr:NADP-dependent oxidoreductase [Dyadobacter psychrotolerans]TDE14548.1 NADP-dependent oxidoreductase [Dyadobacter psychrotolerans]
MKAIILQNAGNAENLEMSEVSVPTIKDNEVLIKVSAIGINPVDIKARSNPYVLSYLLGEERPVILGWDISGTVTEVGKNVTEFEAGDEVFGMINFPGRGNAYAEYVTAPATQVSKKPSNLTHEEAAASSMALLTAWQLLVNHGKVKAGNRVLVHAAAGGVGHFAVQIAKHLGAYVIGTSSAANRDFILAQGADEHIDYKAAPFEETIDNIDFVLDPIGGNTLSRSIGIVNSGGTVASIVTSEFTEEDQQKAKSNGVKLINVFVRSLPEDLASLTDLLEKGIIKPHISQTFAFEEIIQAHQQIETGKTVGKVVVLV